MIRNLKILFYVVLCLSLGSCKKIIKSSDNFIEHKVLSKGGKEISKEAAERSAKEFGSSYVGKSAGHQLVRNAVRKKVEKEMKEEGAKSFFQFGSQKASKELSYASFPSSKSKMMNKYSKKRYNNEIKRLREEKTSVDVSKSNSSVGKRAVKETNKVIARYEGKQMMDYLAKHNPDAKNLIEELLKRKKPNPNTTLDKFVIDVKDNGTVILSHREWKKTEIEIDGNVIRAKAGCRAKSIDKYQDYNELLSVSMPNKKYIIDDIYEIETDELGRVKQTSCILEKDRITLRSGREGNHQKEIVISQNGKEGDQGGHLIQNSLGGPNELINQVPMSSEINQKGLWRAIENYEVKQAWENGKKVISKRTPIYEGNSRRPKAIIIDVIVDGKHAVINGNQCPITIPNP